MTSNGANTIAIIKNGGSSGKFGGSSGDGGSSKLLKI
jgi:hypothetical protein